MLALPLHFAPLPWHLPAREESLSSICEKTAYEFLLSSSVSLCLSGFVATPWGQTMITASVLLQTIVSLAGRYFAKLAADKAIETQSPAWASFSQSLSHIAPCSFSVFTSLNANTLIHEFGHAAMAKLLGGRDIRISLIPYREGVTYYKIHSLNAIGQALGKRTSLIAIVIAGPLLSLALSSLAIFAAHRLKETHPELCNTLLLSGLLNFWGHATYSFSSLYITKPRLSHDFIHLALYGLHPLGATVMIGALPFLIGYYTFGAEEKID